MNNKYRIVTDKFAGYEVQVKKWWFPFGWWQCGEPTYWFTNTWSSKARALEFASKKAGCKLQFNSKTGEYTCIK